jgi:hypothetical protein
MKKCSYCGRDNTDDALNCCECGTEIKRTSGVPLAEEPKHLESSPLKSSKQLANVLIKVLGLSVCLQGVPSFVAGFLRGFLTSLMPLLPELDLEEASLAINMALLAEL